MGGVFLCSVRIEFGNGCDHPSYFATISSVIATRVMNIAIKSEALFINGIGIFEAPTTERLLVIMGDASVREHELMNQCKPWRKFIILDSQGIYLLYDYEIKRVIDIHLCLRHFDGPASPLQIFSGILFLNGVRLIAEMPERALPIKGEMQFVKRGGWQASDETLFVNLRVHKARLEAVSVSFLKRPKFSCE